MHSRTTLGFPRESTCSIITMSRFTPTATFMAPPMLPNLRSGNTQLAMSPRSDTWSAPSMPRSTWPPVIIWNDTWLGKKEPPGSMVT